MIKSRPYCSRNKDGLTSPWYHLNSPDASLSGIGLIGHDNVCRSAAAYLPLPSPRADAFGVELRDVFTDTVSCASHHPAAFCFHGCLLLVPLTAYII